jgi:small subunit ribosomal protein S18
MMARQQRTGRRKSDRDDRKPKKKVSLLDQESVTYVDYKDVNLLRRFMSERAKIRARRVTGNDAQQQREVARAIRVAREMALLPYSVRQVTHRSKGKRDRDDRPLRLDTDGPLRPPPSAPSDGEIDPATAELDEVAAVDAEAVEAVEGDEATELDADAGTDDEAGAEAEAGADDEVEEPAS